MKTTLALDVGSRATALLLALPDFESSLWPRAVFSAERPLQAAVRFLEERQFPAPELTLLCSMGKHPSPSPADPLRMKRWKDKLHTPGLLPEHILHESLPGWEVEPLLEETTRTFGAVLAADSAAATFMAALTLRTVRDRCWQEGITLIYAGESHVQMFMVYKERVWGLYEHHACVPLEIFQRQLQEMRLNWLPTEEVQASGGHGCLCGELPAEAEGFRPTYIFGPCRERFAPCGRLVFPCKDDAFTRCVGLLEALKRRNAP